MYIKNGLLVLILLLWSDIWNISYVELWIWNQAQARNQDFMWGGAN